MRGMLAACLLGLGVFASSAAQSAVGPEIAIQALDASIPAPVPAAVERAEPSRRQIGGVARPEGVLRVGLRPRQ